MASVRASTTNDALFYARGASNVTGTARFDGTTLTLRVKNLAPGGYTVGLARRCPPERRPSDVRRGVVDTRRRAGDVPKPIPIKWAKLGTLMSSDRKPATYEIEIVNRPEGRGPGAIFLREHADVSPSLSDPYGLVACILMERGPMPTQLNRGR